MFFYSSQRLRYFHRIRIFLSFQEDLLHWHVVFGIAAVLYVIGNTVFLIFGSGKEQPLNNYREQDDRDETGRSKRHEGTKCGPFN